MLKLAKVLLVILGLVGLLAACSTAEPLPEGVVNIDPPKTIADFTLLNQFGEFARLSDFQGKLTVLFFGYTHCPDVCPVTLAQMRRVQEMLGDDAAQVNFVFISVDGERDTPERLLQYLANFRANFVGLTGEEDTIRAVIESFNGIFEINNPGGMLDEYTVDHTASTFLLDENGSWRRTYAYNTPPEIIAPDIQKFMK
jgi:protein SCO1/2